MYKISKVGFRENNNNYECEVEDLHEGQIFIQDKHKKLHKNFKNISEKDIFITY